MGKAKTQKSIAYTANVNLTQIAQRSQILKPGRLRMRSRRYRGNSGNAYTAVYKGHTEPTVGAIGEAKTRKTQKSIACKANVNLTQIARILSIGHADLADLADKNFISD
jgi:hypothetical protein